MFSFFASWQRNRRVIDTLSRLSDRELQDVGIGRGDIGSVVRRGKRVDSEPTFDTLAPSWAAQNRRALSA